MLFVVGLGNPGRKYQRTRHNVGFEVVDLLAERHRFPPSKSMFKAEVSRGRIAGNEVFLVKPMTYMNLSGEAVGSVMRYYKGTPEDLVVIHDELDFEPGIVRVKRGGGHGGNNGVRSLISHIGRDFARIRVGIGKPPPEFDGADWVLSKPDAHSRELLNEAVERAADAVQHIVTSGLQACMNTINRRDKQSNKEEDTTQGENQ